MPNPNRHHDYHTRRRRHPPPPPKPSPKLLSIFLKFIVMSLILSFFLLFLGLAAIVLLHLFLAGSFLHRRRRQRATPYSILDLHNHLPPFRYSLESPAPASDECSICLEYFKQGELCRSIPVCDHVFHAHCVDLWLNKVPNCPICRTRIRLDAGGPSDLINGNDDCKFLWAIGVGR